MLSLQTVKRLLFSVISLIALAPVPHLRTLGIGTSYNGNIPIQVSRPIRSAKLQFNFFNTVSPNSDEMHHHYLFKRSSDENKGSDHQG